MRVEYACLDGSPFPVTFADAGDVSRRWVVDREHVPTAMTPLADAARPAGRAGTERAWADSGVHLPSTAVREPPRANGYEYVLEDWLPEGERDAFERALRRLADRHGGTLGVWLGHALPRVREACEWLAAAPPDTPFAELAERRAEVWSHTAVAGALARRDVRAVAASCERVLGERATLVAHALAQGSANDTIAADAALAEAARAAPGSPEADAAVARFLGDFGGRSTSWPIDHPTFAERPDLLEAQVRLLRRRSHRDVETVRREAVDRRRRLADEVRAGLGTGEERERFERRVDRLAAFVPVREARARWQLVASGAVRAVVRARGGVLVGRGVLDAVDEVFLLTPAEYDDPSGDLRAAVAARHVEHRRWTLVTPPPVIGAAGRTAGPAAAGVLHGAPGAPGVAHGPARVILDLADAERLQPGDVLVTTMTSPPWTPLFAVAAAVVTDAGDVMSHVAIAAREYGIACVVGTDVATVLLDDGAVVTVDGERGTVAVAPAPSA